MFNVNNHYVIFSGIFNFDDNKLNLQKLLSSQSKYQLWYKRKKDGYRDNFKSFLDNYFYANFNTTMFNDLDIKTPARLDDLNAVHLNVKMDYNSFFYKEDKCLIDYCDIWLFPYGIGIFTIKAKLCDEISITDLSNFIHYFRNIFNKIEYDNKQMAIYEFVNKYILDNLGNTFTPINKNSFNNKLKSYIICESDIDVSTEEGQNKEDQILFELGTVAPIGSIEKGGFYAPSEEYYDDIINTNKLSVFNNWSGLILFDTFTILINKPQSHENQFSVFYSCEDLYFPIYVKVLFLKFFLFHTNANLARMKLSNPKNKKVRDMFFEISNTFDMSHISYNFLPNKIYDKLKKAMDVDKELDSLSEKIEKINSNIDQKQDAKTNIILSFLSIFAIGSAFFDTSEWIQKLFNIPDSNYLTLSGSIMLGLIVVLIGIYIKIKD